jgi:hypothetical protein
MREEERSRRREVGLYIPSSFLKRSPHTAFISGQRSALGITFVSSGLDQFQPLLSISLSHLQFQGWFLKSAADIRAVLGLF